VSSHLHYFRPKPVFFRTQLRFLRLPRRLSFALLYLKIKQDSHERRWCAVPVGVAKERKKRLTERFGNSTTCLSSEVICSIYRWFEEDILGH